MASRAGGAGGGGVAAAGGGGGGGGGEEPPRPPLGSILPGPLHGVDNFALLRLRIGGYRAGLRFPSADAAARAYDLARLASRSMPFTPNVNDATAAFLRRVLRDAFPARPLGRIDVRAIVAALRAEGTAVRDAALWTPAVAAAASAFAPGAVGLGVAERSTGVTRVTNAHFGFGGMTRNIAASSAKEAARTYDLLSIMRGPVGAGNAWRVVPNCGPDTAAFFRAAVDLHFGAGRSAGVTWTAARRALKDAASPVYAAARWTRRAAATAARTAALLSASPAGWLDAFGDIWEGTAGLDDGGDGAEEEEREGDGDGEEGVGSEEGGDDDEDGVGDDEDGGGSARDGGGGGVVGAYGGGSGGRDGSEPPVKRRR
jgi:hypothetical protein